MADERGGAIVTWKDFRNRPGNYAHRLHASGKADKGWPANGLTLANGVDNQSDALLVEDGAGGAIVAWEVVGGSERDHIVYVHHLMASGVFDPTWPLGGQAVCSIPDVQIDPTIAADGEGGAVLAWVDYRSGGADIYAQHVLSSGVLDPAWPPDGRAICTAHDAQLQARIVTDGAGGAIVAWVDRRNEDEAGDVYAQHVMSSGVVDPAWPVDGRALSTAPLEQSNIVMVADGAGGAMVAWTDPRSSVDGTYSGYYDIYAQHVLASGDVNPAWSTDGLAVCTVPGDQRSPMIVSNGSDGAFLAWLDETAGSVYAQHLLSSGVDPAWPPQGLVICAGSGSRPAMAAAGDGGAFIAWRDGRGRDFDIYAHHLLPSGVDSEWPVNGHAVPTGPGGQSEVAIAADRHGRAFVAWRDDRNGNADIYAMRLDRPTRSGPKGPDSGNDLRFHVSKRGQATAEVTFDLELPEPQSVSITVFDLMGRALHTVESHELPAGTHTLTWDGADGAGAVLKQGVYFVRLSGQTRSVTRKHVVFH